MSILTPFFNLFKPAKTDPAAIDLLNDNMDIIDTEMHRPPLTVNGTSPDSTTRTIQITEVPLATNLSSDIAQDVTGAFVERTSGGDASIDDGSAFLVAIKGNMVHTGYSPMSLTYTLNLATRTEEQDPITVSIDDDTYAAFVVTSGTTTFVYGTAWTVSGSEVNLSTYGITVSGTPLEGDEIVVVFAAENRGTITVTTPSSFCSTGWNLYNNTAGYAKVVKYSDTYGFKLGGSYSLVEFATTVSGSRSAVVMEDGYFNVPANGYVFVTGGDATTYIYATWSDWVNGYQGDFQSYTIDTISLGEAMLNFPNGMFAVGAVADEINLNTKLCINRIQRLTYTAENLQLVINSGMPYECDTNYIYAVMEIPSTHSIEIDGEYTVSDHGIEYFTGTSIPAVAEVLYGENLKDKLRTDVLTISEQELSPTQQKSARTNTQSSGGITVNCGTITSLPATITDARITDKMKVAHWTLGTEANATLPWTVTTANGSLTITGTVSTSGTTLVLDLNEFYPATTV